MAKSAVAQPSSPETTTWSVEDIGQVNDQVEALAKAVNRIKELEEQLETRLLAVEKKTVHLDITDKILPSDVVAGLTPGQFYQTALQAAILSQFMSKPMFNAQSDKYREACVSQCLDFADLALREQLRRIASKPPKS